MSNVGQINLCLKGEDFLRQFPLLTHSQDTRVLLRHDPDPGREVAP